MTKWVALIYWVGKTHLGSQVLSLYSTEFIMAKYPNLPAEAMTQVVDAFVGKQSLAQVGQTWGLDVVEVFLVDLE